MGNEYNMNYASIRTCDIANGEGVRVSLFVSGCSHHCKGCFNPEQWDFAAGEPFDRKVEDEILAAFLDLIIGIRLKIGNSFQRQGRRPARARAVSPPFSRTLR